MNSLKVFACEFEPVTAAGLRTVLSTWPEFNLAGTSASITETLNAAREQTPDVVLLDATASRVHLGEFLRRLYEASPQSRAVLWVDDTADHECARAIAAGARGVIRRTTDLDALRDCLRSVAQGEVWLEDAASPGRDAMDRRSGTRLTPREREILQGILRGCKNREIAHELGISSGTVKVHLLHIYEKAGVRDRFELAVRGRTMLDTAQET